MAEIISLWVPEQSQSKVKLCKWEVLQWIQWWFPSICNFWCLALWEVFPTHPPTNKRKLTSSPTLPLPKKKKIRNAMWLSKEPECLWGSVLAEQADVKVWLKVLLLFLAVLYNLSFRMFWWYCTLSVVQQDHTKPLISTKLSLLIFFDNRHLWTSKCVAKRATVLAVAIGKCMWFYLSCHHLLCCSKVSSTTVWLTTSRILLVSIFQCKLLHFKAKEATLLDSVCTKVCKSWVLRSYSS